jgi:3-methylfumaryl-CoA hydratase
MGAWDHWIGRNVTQRDRLTPGLLNRFRATLDSGETGDIAPQAVHWVLCTPEAPTAQLGPDGHPLRGDSPDSFMPPIPLPRRMWASSKVEFIAPIRVDAEIERTSTIASISEKDGSTGKLVFVGVAHETRANGVLAVGETQTLVYREATSTIAQSSPVPAAVPAHAPPDFGLWGFHRSLTPDETLLFRFSAITFNTHRIHYDMPYATGEEGYRGLVVHGPLLASLLLDLAAQKFGSNALKSFEFRAQSPAFAGEPLHLVGRQEGRGVMLVALGGDGRVCVSAEAVLND